MRLAPWIIAAIVSFSLWRLYSQRDISHQAGVLAGADPEQFDVDGAAVRRGGVTLRPRPGLSAPERNQRREGYYMGPHARRVPPDF